MIALHASPRWTVIHGEALRVLRELPAGSVDAVITDPPFVGPARLTTEEPG